MVRFETVHYVRFIVTSFKCSLEIIPSHIFENCSKNYLHYEKYFDISPSFVFSWIDSKTRTNLSSSPRRSNRILRRRGRKKRTRSGNLAARLDGGRKRRRRNGGHRPSGNGTATKSDNLRNERSRHGEAEVGQGHQGEEGPGAGSKKIGGTEEVDIAYICLFRFLSQDWKSVVSVVEKLTIRIGITKIGMNETKKPLTKYVSNKFVWEV